ncbi:MAG TPA: hypothetical protein VJL37_05520 [Flavobacterium sp.]|nr:hypothetical protein [Flavobacterium sp.]
MLKNILNLDGAQQLSGKAQKEINGGNPVWCGYCICDDGSRVHACGNAANTCLVACNS